MVATATKPHILCSVVRLRDNAAADDVVWLGPVLANRDIHAHGRVIPFGDPAVFDLAATTIAAQLASAYQPSLIVNHDDGDGKAYGRVVDLRVMDRAQAQRRGLEQRDERGIYLAVKLNEAGRERYEAGTLQYVSVGIDGPFTSDDGTEWPVWLHELSIVSNPRFKSQLPADALRGVRLRDVDEDALNDLLRAFQAFAVAVAPGDEEEEPESASDDEAEAEPTNTDTNEPTEVEMSEKTKGGEARAAEAPDLSVKLAEAQKEADSLRAQLAEQAVALENEKANNKEISERTAAIEAKLAEREKQDAIEAIATQVSDLGGSLSDVTRETLGAVYGSDLFAKLGEDLVKQAGERAPKTAQRDAGVGAADLAADTAAIYERARQLRAASGPDATGNYRMSLAEAKAQAMGGK